VAYITDEISKIFLSYKEEFMILLTKSAGSRFEGIRDRLTSLTSDKFNEEFIPLLDEDDYDDHLCEILALSLIEGLICIFNIYPHEDEKLKLLLAQYLKIFFAAVKK
jgi:hypothetical protein